MDGVEGKWPRKNETGLAHFNSEALRKKALQQGREERSGEEGGMWLFNRHLLKL